LRINNFKLTIDNLGEKRMTYPFHTHIYEHTHQLEYWLSPDHAIYQRSLNTHDPKQIFQGQLIPATDTNWHLFDSIGVPYKGNYNILLDMGEYITEIAVASEVLIAVSNLNRVYLYKLTQNHRPVSWRHKLGQPFPRPLYLPADRRSWTFSVSIGDTLKKSTSFIHSKDRNRYYEDASGSSHEFGFTGTLYVLSNCGQQIFYWDTGLAPSFSRGFLSPLNGETQGQMISSAGSTIFISTLDRNNTLRFFTRMFDYEIFGGCPGFSFSYQSDSHRSCVNSEKMTLGKGVRKLPLPGWLEHDVSSCFEYDISHHISIEMLGSGNANREMRIFAKNPNGVSGYLYKKIDETQWFFKSCEDINTHYLTQPCVPYNADIQSPLKNYTGICLKSSYDPSEFQFSLLNFHPLLTASEPAIIRIQNSYCSTDLKLHSLDGWSIISTQTDHHELIGTVDGHEKVLRATIILPDEFDSLLYKSPGMYHFISNLISPYHNKTNAIVLRADTAKVMLDSEDHKLKFFFYRELNAHDIANSFFVKQANAAHLVKIPSSEAERLQILECNQITLKNMIHTRQSFKKKVAAFFGTSVIVTSGCLALRPVTKVFGKIFGEHGKLPVGSMGHQATKDLTTLMYTQGKVCLDTFKNNDSTYDEAIKILQTRIAHLSSFH